MSKPVICVTMGDPSGIGPEIIIKALNGNRVYNVSCPVVVASPAVLEKMNNDVLKLPVTFNLISNPREASYSPGLINIIPIDEFSIAAHQYGVIQAQSGRASYQCIEKSVDLALAKFVDAVATTPINKEAIKAAKVNFIGHTEMYADLTNTVDPLTMFQIRNMRVFFLSRHLSLRKACDVVKKEKIVEYVVRCRKELQKLGIVNPLLAVAGLNPHNGEHGLFGDEELTEIEPAVRELSGKGHNVVGPIAPDSVFAQALAGKYDGVLALYHDQGHIATKTVDFERTISLTLGLPFLRTSVDHGTAFDIAGQGVASAVSMEEAILVAAEYVSKSN